MASLLKELIRKPHSSRFISTLTQQKSPLNFTPQLFSDYQSIFCHGVTLNPSVNKGFRARDDEEQGFEVGSHLSDLQIYPSFSFGFFLDPKLSPGSGLSQLVMPVGAETEHPGMMWADSVKKKRKKKMNKHKYKKLRKRLRRKTKT